MKISKKDALYATNQLLIDLISTSSSLSAENRMGMLAYANIEEGLITGDSFEEAIQGAYETLTEGDGHKMDRNKAADLMNKSANSILWFVRSYM